MNEHQKFNISGKSGTSADEESPVRIRQSQSRGRDDVVCSHPNETSSHRDSQNDNQPGQEYAAGRDYFLSSGCIC